MRPLSELLALVLHEEKNDQEKFGALWNQWADTEAVNQLLQQIFRIQQKLQAPFATVKDIRRELVRTAMFALYATQRYPHLEQADKATPCVSKVEGGS